MEAVLETEEWATLKDRLLDFVTNFEWKVVQASSGFQM
jgi:hypothetical protein